MGSDGMKAIYESHLRTVSGRRTTNPIYGRIGGRRWNGQISAVAGRKPSTAPIYAVPSTRTWEPSTHRAPYKGVPGVRCDVDGVPSHRPDRGRGQPKEHS